ncbi:MAG TPA: glycosyltransferase family A protein [Steroidobacteraceae bacterium]|nr:glycosyltransferase family A protein [Steroidobacteraceae bacterium]
MRDPEVSIVMPTFNRLDWLRCAVASVLVQTHRDWELILIDDGSEAPTREYLRGLRESGDGRFRVIFGEHCGNPPAVRNVALREARGDYVAFLDSDDLWLPAKLERQLASLRASPDREWSYTAAVMVDGSARPLGRSLPYPKVRDGWIAESLLRGQAAVTQSSVLIRRAALQSVGGYPEDLPVCGDYELFVRLALRSEVDFVAEDLVLVRRHGEHYSNDIEALRDLYRFIRKMQCSRLAPHMADVLRARRVEVARGIARAIAAGIAPEWLKELVRGSAMRRSA